MLQDDLSLLPVTDSELEPPGQPRDPTDATLDTRFPEAA